MSMHSEHSVAEHLHADADVELQEHAAIAAALIPISREPIAIPERRVDVVAVVHHEAVTGTVKTIEQPKLLARAAQTIARRDEHALRDRHSDPRVEVPLQNAVVAPRLVPIVALR